MKLSADALKLLGLPEDADEAAVNSAISTAFADLPELKEFSEKNKKEKAFAEAYPEEAAKLKKLEEDNNELAAKAFSERFSRIVTVDGEGDEAKRVNTTKGFSGLVLDKIASFAKGFNEGTADLKGFSEVLDAITVDKAIVDYGEIGSTRVNDEDLNSGKIDNVAKAFAEKATEIMNKANAEKEGSMSWGDAVSQAMREYPDLAKAYSERKLPKA